MSILHCFKLIEIVCPRNSVRSLIRSWSPTLVHSICHRAVENDMWISTIGPTFYLHHEKNSLQGSRVVSTNLSQVGINQCKRPMILLVNSCQSLSSQGWQTFPFYLINLFLKLLQMLLMNQRFVISQTRATRLERRHLKEYINTTVVITLFE